MVMTNHTKSWTAKPVTSSFSQYYYSKSILVHCCHFLFHSPLRLSLFQQPFPHQRTQDLYYHIVCKNNVNAKTPIVEIDALLFYRSRINNKFWIFCTNIEKYIFFHLFTLLILNIRDHIIIVSNICGLMFKKWNIK